MARLFHRVFCCVVFIVGASVALADSGLSSGAQYAVGTRIEVCFVLDTTGSMSGLIEGAKRKIWSIANHIASGPNTSEVLFSLVAFRDRGDAYVTHLVDLTPDIDFIYQELKGYQADGGGDTPESVNQALYESVYDIRWSGRSDEDALENTETALVKVIFLLGDSPPHMDYEEQQYPETVRQAVEKGIVVNAIQAGTNGATRTIWKEIAIAGGGIFSQIAQSGNMVNIVTHYDQDLVALNIKLGETLLSYGNTSQRESVEALQRSSEKMPHQQIADRASFYAQKGRIVQATGDLIGDLENGVVRLEDIAFEDLPEPLQGLSTDEQLLLLEETKKTRRLYQQTILKLAQARQAEIENKQSGASFDREVVEQIRKLATRP